ncbi:Short-chain dehydrogenase/reductase SDR [Sesbania bispinosa]|nr:Short-chain dehydrogenase/reductase SDR [Sesbania bispinosa]
MAESGNSKLAGKVAIITGGASGIGEEKARLFSNQGSQMVVIADIQDDLGNQVAASIGSHKCSYVHCDVSDEDQVKHLVESTVNIHGQLDIMFNNAGVVSPSEQTVLNLDFSQFDRIFAVNARGMALCVKHAARAMVNGRVRGSIVCTVSVAASHGRPDHTDYAMSKHAVVGLMRSASVQLGAHGIRVNCVSPGGLATLMTRAGLGMEDHEVQQLFAKIARLKGIALTTKHIAEAILFLASDDSEFVNGQDLAVDGGYRG